MNKFSPKEASLVDFNRELKRLASKKCRAKNSNEKAQAEKEYAKVVAAKEKKFGEKKTYEKMSADEILSLDLETTVKAIKSLQSKKCTRPDLKTDILKIEFEFQTHKNELIERAQFESLKAKYK